MLSVGDAVRHHIVAMPCAGNATRRQASLFWCALIFRQLVVRELFIHSLCGSFDLKMSDDEDKVFHNSRVLTMSEIDRQIDIEDDSEDEFSSSNSWKLNSDGETDSDIERVSEDTADQHTPPHTQPVTQQPTTTGNRHRGRKQTWPVLPWSVTPDMKTYLFSQPTGLRIPVLDDEPIVYFNMIFDKVFLESVVRETNGHAEESFLSESTLENSRITG
ncbi:hypothetical protein J6590_048122 [Homalodisca vitripennis]|nr:hypothetical protein J6590_048122 [Homalodisca vitripennis]